MNCELSIVHYHPPLQLPPLPPPLPLPPAPPLPPTRPTTLQHIGCVSQLKNKAPAQLELCYSQSVSQSVHHSNQI